MIALGAIVFAFISPASAQLAGGLMFPGPGMPHTTGYVGPGDVSINGTTTNVKGFYSCSRVLNNAKATTATSMCDLVDSAAPTTVICTLRGSTSGFVDLTAYCPGSVTPAAKCAAATGGVCNIGAVYDQAGGIGNTVASTTASHQSFLVFSALNGLPVMRCTGSICSSGTTTVNFTLAQPIVIASVYTVNPTSSLQGVIIEGLTSQTGADSGLGSLASKFGCYAGNASVSTAADAAWHGASCLLNGSSGINNIDGSNTTQNFGTNGFSAELLRIFTNNAANQTMIGSIAETMIIGSTASTTDLNNLFANMNGTNGYNGGL